MLFVELPVGVALLVVVAVIVEAGVEDAEAVFVGDGDADILVDGVNVALGVELALAEELPLGLLLKLCVVEGDTEPEGLTDGVPEALSVLLWLVDGVLE